MVFSNAWGGVSVGFSLYDWAIASEPEKGGFVDLTGAVVRARENAGIITFKPNERIRRDVEVCFIFEPLQSLVVVFHAEPEDHMGGSIEKNIEPLRYGPE